MFEVNVFYNDISLNITMFFTQEDKHVIPDLVVARLNSTEYTELRDKLQAPVRNASNVVIHLTMSELFLETFKSFVELNQVYEHTSGQVRAAQHTQVIKTRS